MSDSRFVLLVDDDNNDVVLTLSALAEINFGRNVVVLRDGAEALDFLRYTGEFARRAVAQPAVVLLDIKMPKISGLDVLRTMRSDESLAMIPVVILTSSREECDVMDSYQLGVNAYVVKPVGYDKYVQSIQHLGEFWGHINQPAPDRFGS
jgi:CheY-like chemotaxis protein